MSSCSRHAALCASCTGCFAAVLAERDDLLRDRKWLRGEAEKLTRRNEGFSNSLDHIEEKRDDLLDANDRLRRLVKQAIPFVALLELRGAGPRITDPREWLREARVLSEASDAEGLRCAKTGNPCGTDTWPADRPCQWCLEYMERRKRRTQVPSP